MSVVVQHLRVTTQRRAGTRHQQAVDRIVVALRRLPWIVAIGAYGSTSTRQWTRHSDVDLLAVTETDPPLESLRFFVDGIAVDLNFRSPDATEHGLAGADFVPDATPLWDPDGVFDAARPTRRTHNAVATDAVRYMLFHDTQKLRQIEDRTLRRLAMGQVVEQVMRAWYQARDEAFPGAVASVHDLRDRALSMIELLDAAVLTSSVDKVVEAAEIAAAPAGGIFHSGETLALSWARPAVEPVPELLRALVDEVADRTSPRV